VNPISVVGHITIDRIVTHEGKRQQLGGPPTYVSLITSLLGVPLRVCTKVGGDFPCEYTEELAGRGVHIHDSVVPSAKTTRFILDYTGLERRLGVESICELIKPDDVRELPEVTILAPIIQEIPTDTLQAIRSPFLALDPQGFVRRCEPDFSISLRPWQNRDLLRRLSVFKASERELRLVAEEGGWSGLDKLSKFGVKVAIVTYGENGSHVLAGGRRLFVPAFNGETVDTTGAGDAFMAGYFSVYSSGSEVDWCLAVGSASASAVVETLGPRIKISRSELLERAEKILDEIVVLA
jgi:sugar/nucleoside kinase (ribokinase family)